MNRKFVFIGGKQIGVNCLKIILENGLRPEFVVPNRTDNGTNKSWHESLIKVAQDHNLRYMAGIRVSDESIVTEIEQLNPDIIFCIGGMQIIPERVLRASKLGCLNIHPAYLPLYRGRYSTAHALANGEKETGVTLQWMDEGIDTGPIIMQEKIIIEESDTAKTLYDKFTNKGTDLFKVFLKKWVQKEDLTGVIQDESKSSYYPKGLPNNGEIDWSWTGKRIKNFIRAMTFEPFNPPSFFIGDKKMVIVEEKYFKGYEEHE